MTVLLDKKLHFLKPDDILCPININRMYLNDGEIRALAENISANGVLQPITVRPIKNGKYEVVSGQRRLKAAKMLGLRRIPCIVRKLDEQTSAIFSLSENLFRDNLNFFEEAKEIKNILTRYNMDISAVAEKLGMSRSAIISKLNLLNLNEDLKHRILLNGITERQAKIINLVPKEKQNEALDEILETVLSTEKVKEITDKFIFPEDGIDYSHEEAEPLRKTSIGDVRLFSNSITKLLITLQNSGYDAYQRRTENDKYIEYRIRILKSQPENYKQLKLV